MTFQIARLPAWLASGPAQTDPVKSRYAQWEAGTARRCRAGRPQVPDLRGNPRCREATQPAHLRLAASSMTQVRGEARDPDSVEAPAERAGDVMNMQARGYPDRPAKPRVGVHPAGPCGWLLLGARVRPNDDDRRRDQRDGDGRRDRRPYPP